MTWNPSAASVLPSFDRASGPAPVPLNSTARRPRAVPAGRIAKLGNSGSLRTAALVSPASKVTTPEPPPPPPSDPEGGGVQDTATTNAAVAAANSPLSRPLTTRSPTVFRPDRRGGL